MSSTDRAERIALLSAEGGRAAAGFWLLRHVLRIDVYRFYAVALEGFVDETRTSLPDGYAFLALSSLSDVNACDQRLLTQLDERSGSGVAGVVRRQGRIYAIAHADRVVSQLCIDPERAL